MSGPAKSPDVLTWRKQYDYAFQRALDLLTLQQRDLQGRIATLRRLLADLPERGMAEAELSALLATHVETVDGIQSLKDFYAADLYTLDPGKQRTEVKVYTTSTPDKVLRARPLGSVISPEDRKNAAKALILDRLERDTLAPSNQLRAVVQDAGYRAPDFYAAVSELERAGLVQSNRTGLYRLRPRRQEQAS